MKRNLIIALLVSLLVTLSLCPAQDGPKVHHVKEDVAKVVKGNNEFAFDLYKRLSQEQKGNVVLSPYSISTALAMTYGRARGKTADEMAKTLHFTLPQEELHPAFGDLIADLQKEDKNRPYNLYIANALWGQKGYGFKDEFLQLTRKNYGAGLREVDYANASEDAQTINRWVEEQTKDKIKELLPRDVVDPETRLFLTNAMYFKATWKTPFPKRLTKQADFETPTATVSVPMMSSVNRGQFNYFAGDGFQWLELPYVGDRIAMVVLLPTKTGSLVDLEKTLTSLALEKGLGKLGPHLGSVALPRFKVTTECRLKETLAKMGMPLAFTPGADFSGMAPSQRLRITAVMHKAFIDVDEVGTEAAAATGVGVGGDKGYPPFTFRADHPFLFFIRDTYTGSILFMGRVTDPSHSE